MTIEMLGNAASRVSYTEEAIKDAFLNLLKCKDYMDITVTDICKTAGVSRGTFYAHFDNIAKLIDTLFEEALSNVGNIPLQYICLPGNSQNDGLPLCMFLRKNKKYQPLFFSDSLHSYVVDRMAESYRRSFVERLQKESGLGEETLNALFYFQLNGCLAISKRNISVSDDAWAEIQCSVDRFLKHGFENL
jgi:AcrR family transcriptional regulator